MPAAPITSTGPPGRSTTGSSAPFAEACVWHEAYRVRPGDFETVYNNMPPFGLARATHAVAAVGRRETAAGRLAGASFER